MAEASRQYPRNSHIVVNSDNMAVVGFLPSGTANFIKNTVLLYYFCKFLLFFNSKYFVKIYSGSLVTVFRTVNLILAIKWLKIKVKDIHLKYDLIILIILIVNNFIGLNYYKIM